MHASCRLCLCCRWMHACVQELNWDHSFVRELPGDPETKNAVRQVGARSSSSARIRVIIAIVVCARGAGELLWWRGSHVWADPASRIPRSGRFCVFLCGGTAALLRGRRRTDA